MNSSNDDYQINNLENSITYIYKYVLLIVYVISNIGNLSSVLIFMKKSWKKNVCVFYFKIYLLINSCYTNTTILATIFTNGFQINLRNSNIIVCKLYLYTSLLFISLSPTVLTLASIDRLLISSQNVDTRLYSSKRLAYFSISASTCFWIIFHMHALIEGGIQEVYPSDLVCGYNASVFYYNFVTFSLGVIYVIFCFLIIILCLFAFKNVRRIRAVPREKRTNQIRSMTKKDFQLLRCLFVQDIVYIFFSMLFIIFYVYEGMTKYQIRTALAQSILNFLQEFLTFMFNIYYSANFFIFVIVSKAFRHELKRIIYKFIGKNLTPMREEENRQDNIIRDNIDLNAVVVVSTIVLPV